MKDYLIIQADPRMLPSQMEDLAKDLADFLPEGTSFFLSTSITGVHVIHRKEEES